MKFTCEVCNAPAGAHGVTCNPCQAARLDSLLKSRAWREVAATRSGDLPGETLLDTIRREKQGLRSS